METLDELAKITLSSFPFQHIAFYEWLPAFLSSNYTKETLQRDHPYQGNTNTEHSCRFIFIGKKRHLHPISLNKKMFHFDRLQKLSSPRSESYVSIGCDAFCRNDGTFIHCQKVSHSNPVQSNTITNNKVRY